MPMPWQTPGIFGPLTGAAGMGGLFGGQQIPQGGVMGEPQINPQADQRMAIAAQLLAGSGWSPQRRGFGEILGNALMAGQQARMSAQQMVSQQLREKADQEFRQAQMANMNQEPADVRTARALMADPALRKQFEEMQSLGFNVNDPADVRTFKFRQSLSPEQRREFDNTRFAPPAVSFQNTPGLGSAIVDPGNRLGGGPVRTIVSPEQERAAAAAASGAQAQATAAGTVTGREGAEAIQNLGTAEQNAKQTLDVLAKLRNHKGLPFITGVYSLAPIVPDTDQAGADALAKQVEGQAFLQAFETLKGGGQITQIEGEKATQAIGRLSRAQKVEDYQEALDELIQIANAGLERARKKASAASTSQPGADPAVRKYNPATGRIE